MNWLEWSRCPASGCWTGPTPRDLSLSHKWRRGRNESHAGRRPSELGAYADTQGLSVSGVAQALPRVGLHTTRGGRVGRHEVSLSLAKQKILRSLSLSNCSGGAGDGRVGAGRDQGLDLELGRSRLVRRLRERRLCKRPQGHHGLHRRAVGAPRVGMGVACTASENGSKEHNQLRTAFEQLTESVESTARCTVSWAANYLRQLCVR